MKAYAIESVFYTPEECAAMFRQYKPNNCFYLFVFYGIDIPYSMASMCVSMSNIEHCRSIIGNAPLTPRQEETLLATFMANARGVSARQRDIAISSIWLLAQNNLEGLKEISAIPEKDCISIRIVLKETEVSTVYSQFAMPELIERAAAAKPLFS